MDFIQQFKAARRVSTPIINMRTFDAKGLTRNISAALNGTLDSTPMLIWDSVHGLLPMNNTKASKEAYATLMAKAGLETPETVQLPETLKALETDGVSDMIVFISNAHLLWGDPTNVQAVWNLRDIYKNVGNMLVLVSTPGATLPIELQTDVLVLDEPLPTREELAVIVRNTFKSANAEASLTTDIEKSAVDALIGLSSFSADQATAMCLTTEKIPGKEKESIRKGTLSITDLWERKRQIINATPGLTVYKGKETLDDIGGIESAKEFYRAVMTGKNAPEVILFIDEIEKQMAGNGTDSSGTKTEMNGIILSWMEDKGVNGALSIGIPGVSKSQLAKSLGATYNKPVIVFDIAAMQDMHVGNSGHNLRTATKTIDAISSGNVLCIATCNGIANLPPELRRRFSLVKFFFDSPNASERDEIWTIQRRNHGLVNDEPNPPSENWTGAEIRDCCKKADMLNWPLAKAATYIVPSAISDAATLEKTRLEASGRYLSASKVGTYYHDETTRKDNSDITGPVFAGSGRKIRD